MKLKIAALPSVEKIKQTVFYCDHAKDLVFARNTTKNKKGDFLRSNKRNGYAQVRIDGKKFLAHRLVWKLCTGEDPVGVVDHIDGDIRNNAFENLRDVSVAENLHNRHKQGKGRSGLIGASWNSKKQLYSSEYSVKGVRTKLGFYKTALDAHKAYMAAKHGVVFE